MRTYSLCLLFLLCCTMTSAQELTFEIPIKGTLGVDVILVNHVDHDDNTATIRDFQCGVLTYDGHDGTDFVIPSFAAMDSGVVVRAAAAGVVIAMVDTLYDRNKVSVVARGFGNYISIRHRDGYVTYYAHIKTGSAIVNVGDVVVSGQPIAQVGSSGNSSDPHLHFEVWQRVDPFAGACANDVSHWNNQPVPTEDFMIVDHDITDWPPTLDTIRERPPSALVIDSTAETVTFWSLLSGVQATDEFAITWYAPDGGTWFTYSSIPGFRTNYYYWFTFINRPPTSGEWTCELFRNGASVARNTFQVIAPVTSVENDDGDVPSPLLDLDGTGTIADLEGKIVASSERQSLRLQLQHVPNGTYVIRTNGKTVIVVVVDGQVRAER